VAERARWNPVALGEWALVAGLFTLLAWLPEGAAYAAGEGIARFAFRVDRRHRGIALENLVRAFPDAGRTGGLEELAGAVFENLGRTAVDVARAGRLLRRAGPAIFQMDGLERMVEARARGKGVLVLTAHFGPWELLPLSGALHYGPIHVVARPMDNPWLDDWLTALRERGGNHVIRKRDAVQAILQVLRRGETVGILIDQHVSENEGVVVPFFGRPASTMAGPALLALRSGAAVLPVGITRSGRGRYRVDIRPEVSVRRSGDLKADLVENTAQFTAAIEAIIRERPDHWFWVHRRWKTEQPLDPRLPSHDLMGRSPGQAPSHQDNAFPAGAPASAPPDG
jgi:KDO2-lipid IV(A) lauroyltransferase